MARERWPLLVAAKVARKAGDNYNGGTRTTRAEEQSAFQSRGKEGGCVQTVKNGTS